MTTRDFIIILLIAFVGITLYYSCEKPKDETKQYLDSLKTERKILRDKIDSVDFLKYQLMQQIFESDCTRAQLKRGLTEKQKHFYNEKEKLYRLPLDPVIDSLAKWLSSKPSV